MAEENNQYKFTGVFIPAEIYESQDLSWMEKLLWAEIQALSGKEVCYASNAHFAKHLRCTEAWISQSISKLKKLGLIKQVGFDGRVRKLVVCFEPHEEKVCILKKTDSDYNKTEIQTIRKVKGSIDIYNNNKYIPTEIQNEIKKEMYKENEIPPEGCSPSLPPQGDSNCPAAHFKDLWNNRLVVNYSNAYPANVKIPRITTAEIKNLSVRDTELKKLVKELLADGIITQAELDAVDGDRWRWAFKQVWERITKSRFLRGEVYSDGRTPYLFDVTHFLRKDAFVRLVTPVRVSKYCLDDPR